MSAETSWVHDVARGQFAHCCTKHTVYTLAYNMASGAASGCCGCQNTPKIQVEMSDTHNFSPYLVTCRPN